ncbi:MraY family glycosyltransferase [Olsenella sp. YH-ols2217]|uniref:MraY family glycosyltransferase n=1 Tax=Kribbibacterium absianum TaxID=3044210 RepID=A0ABT6ZMP4_9ACTN|nr:MULTISPECIES: MraY family glycosyltransferase [unclassified Olsenella]MDJ1122066.1 MraY family glycosyltransferase [Olsenella sp. YH-ols2216]MDJ1130074.1 MraY family glycosyltransferase [Olsenella sp. YH-ols2217]
MDWFAFACAFLTAFLVTLLCTPVARRIAIALGAVDRPAKRRVNRVPIPRMGGIAVALGMACAFGLLAWGAKAGVWSSVFFSEGRQLVNYPVLGLSLVVIFLTGAVDDVRGLRPLPKLCLQVAAAVVAAASGLVIGNVVNPFAPGEVNLGWMGYVLTVVYLVAFANIINLIDGLDGLASGVSCISSLTLFVLAFNAGRYDAAGLAIVLCGATLGFLRYNFNPAGIFLGDSGSLLLGFSLGCISLLSVTRVAGLTMILLPLVLAWVPIMDTFSAIVRRRRAHVSVGQADKGHIHHRLIQEGFNQRQAVLLIYLWTFLLCAGAIVMTQVGLWPRIAIFLFLMAFSALFAVKLRLFQPVLLHHYDSEGHDELISPDDPSFAEEAHRQHMER